MGAREPPVCVKSPDGVTAYLVIVDATNMSQLARVASLNDDGLIEAAASAIDE